MGEPLKNMFFTSSSLNALADRVKKFYPAFDKKAFLNLVMDADWESRELKEKMRHTTLCLNKCLPKSYKTTLEILKKAAPLINGFEAMVFPDYVECFGMDEWDLSLEALGYFTKFGSSEFAIRPFLHKDPERTMIHMFRWAEDKDEKVRRFASEGCRPRLPWAMALPVFKRDPSGILPILEKLKNDESEFVRRSVANNLNDISKDHPQLVLDISKRWLGLSKNTDAIIKHACRNLLKAGNKQALLLFGFSDPIDLSVDNLRFSREKIFIGEEIYFTFDLVVKTGKKSKIRLEYVVYFVKAKNKTTKKVFQIIENEYPPGVYPFKRKHSFVNMSTRKHYAGDHKISIIVNGVEMAAITCTLVD